ncbi:cellulose biosynthesis protein BcsS [Methylobacterium sp. NEAU 140]|uniref:cellulose biosynthesis protein BcsS n=1 Tax=Methylobacterium sp. NEAU 140 TaxID=3064945 RepID=UPI0027329C7F|nr:cellulose biosynthesis protein BcsS [Methylobacterium sp. NEAU 140]MDP4021057.1 cellulose biosynthesis protein BcsS [Methylobacterium sp. NEAU 140]
MRDPRSLFGGARPLPAGGAALLAALAGSPAALGGELDALLFGSLDAGAATFVTAGAKIAPGPLDRAGFAMLASVGGGRRTERGGCDCAPGRGYDLALTRYTVAGAAVLGYQWFFDWGVVAAFAGPEGTMELLTDGRAVAALPARFGLRLHGEVWARPTEETLLQATGIAGSARDSVWARLAWGYRLWETYLGPEASLYTDATGYRKWNLGLHGTDFALGRYSVRVSAGAQIETGARRISPYVALSVWAPW